MLVGYGLASHQLSCSLESRRDSKPPSFFPAMLFPGDAKVLSLTSGRSSLFQFSYPIPGLAPRQPFSYSHFWISPKIWMESRKINKKEET